MDPDYVESVWWSLKQIFDKGLLVEDYRVAPYCPRCGTGLSDHEVAQGYETVIDPSVYVRLPADLRPAGRRGGAAGLDDDAVDARLQHRRRRAPRRDLRRRRPTAPRRSSSPSRCWPRRSARAGAPTGERFTGARDGALDLPAPVRPGRHRRPTRTTSSSPTTSPPRTAPAWCTSRPRSAPTTSRSAARYGLPVVNPIRAGRPLRRRASPLVGGQFFKDADETLVADLAARGLLFRHVPYEHSYPHCWRCHTALMYYAQPSWYIRTTAVKDELLRGERGDQLVSPTRSSTAATATG